MFERSAIDTRCVLVHAELMPVAEATESGLEEFTELARSAGLEAQTVFRLRRRVPHPRFYFGRGQIEEIERGCKAAEVKLVVINADLSPSQERNLELCLHCRVLSRTGLILDIFAQRARSHEGKLQVELAQLSYLSTRLVRGWSHLERQKGGIGLRGPGETQLESDRRLLTRRLQHLRKRLTRVTQQREQSRKKRRERLFQVTLVGYTNAGKSTVFNYLTGSDVEVRNRLFATLDPTHRHLEIGAGPGAILSDTVGFIGALPIELIQAFHSTLEEVRDCDLLLHVIDRSDPQYRQRITEVRTTLKQIEADQVPVLEVYNKIDCLPASEQVSVGQKRSGRVSISARTGAGMEALREGIRQHALVESSRLHLRLPAQAYSLRAELYRRGRVEEERFTASGECEMRLWLPSSWRARYAQFQVPASPVH